MARHFQKSIHTGFNVFDDLKKLWQKKGTASYPLVFQDRETGEEYEVTGSYKTDYKRHVTVVEIHAKET